MDFLTLELNFAKILENQIGTWDAPTHTQSSKGHKPQ